MHQQYRVSRRDVLKGLFAGAAGATLSGLLAPNLGGVGVARAQVTPSTGNPTAYHFSVGALGLIAVKDLSITPNATIFGSNQPEADVLALFEEAGVLRADNTITAMVDILVMREGDTLAVFDTGFGPANGGALVSTLGTLGIAPEDVTHVVHSHFHPDHVNGLSQDGTLTFPNAMVAFPQAEYDFLQNAPENVAGNALARLQPALDAGMVTFYVDGDAVVPCVTAIAAPGHTPGHTAFMIAQGDASLLHIVDAALNLYAQVPNPDWHAAFDADGAAAAATRRALLDMAAADRVPVFGYHFPFPGVYNIRADGDGFRATPVGF